MGELPFNACDALLLFFDSLECPFEPNLPAKQGSSFAFQADAKLLNTDLVVLIRFLNNRANNPASWCRHGYVPSCIWSLMLPSWSCCS
jgi:hypothetical protein